jgi:lambda repressor-like predicted transcriptional regulator
VTTAFQERQAIIAYIRKRRESVAALAKRGQLTEADAFRLKRWLDTLADDIDAQLHDEDGD